VDGGARLLDGARTRALDDVPDLELEALQEDKHGLLIEKDSLNRENDRLDRLQGVEFLENDRLFRSFLDLLLE
jgi:hypothetical protein